MSTRLLDTRGGANESEVWDFVASLPGGPPRLPGEYFSVFVLDRGAGEEGQSFYKQKKKLKL